MSAVEVRGTVRAWLGVLNASLFDLVLACSDNQMRNARKRRAGSQPEVLAVTRSSGTCTFLWAFVLRLA